MADPLRYPDSGEHAGMPRWVKVLGIVVAVVVLLVVAVMFIGGGGHRPRRHGGAGSDAPPASIIQVAPLGVGGGAGIGGSPSWGR